MKQPDLGKKISELRKAKGLTQEELVTKCNLNVRTLQRIESGAVTPRSFTVRQIFAALDYKDSLENMPNKLSVTGHSSTNRPEQLKTQDSIKQANFKVLKDSPCPALLLNIGYLTNSNDLSYVSDIQNQILICDKIITAIGRIDK